MAGGGGGGDKSSDRLVGELINYCVARDGTGEARALEWGCQDRGLSWGRSAGINSLLQGLSTQCSGLCQGKKNTEEDSLCIFVEIWATQ